MSSNGLVPRLWNYCNVLRDDGLAYGDYLEQLTYLLFLDDEPASALLERIAAERAKAEEASSRHPRRRATMQRS